ncbi:hypothetical protein EUTSA_v10011824mg [Eutrema salsugineum]|uniref:Uncharacterized protein n=2 Tax=Eutrema salsugineum TaxID=72664 RepID=V4KHT0_EUTSA|nr:hypothetical protein EUTSA_v10011824mg [Eutrema salsugineum]
MEPNYTVRCPKKTLTIYENYISLFGLFCFSPPQHIVAAVASPSSYLHFRQERTMANKIAMLLSEAMNSNAVINTCLGVSFVVLGLRSDKQQKYVEALQEQKESLLKSNKEMKVTMWEWKQQLFAEAATSSASAVVPLSTLKGIYGEVTTTTQSGDTVKEDPKVSTPTIMV